MYKSVMLEINFDPMDKAGFYLVCNEQLYIWSINICKGVGSEQKLGTMP